MATSFPGGNELGPALERGKNGESSIYLVLTGPNRIRGDNVNIPLFWIETGRDEIFQGPEVADRLKRYGDYDPHGPYWMTARQLAASAMSHEISLQQEERRHTEEIDAIVG